MSHRVSGGNVRYEMSSSVPVS